MQAEVSGSLSVSTVSWLNLVPLTAQEGSGKTVSECRMGCIMKREEGWAEISYPVAVILSL